MSAQIKTFLSSTSAEKGRKAPRTRCRVAATLTYLASATPGQVVDVSTTGLAFDLAGPFRGIPGSKVRIESRELGSLEGKIKWIRNGRVGIEFDGSSNADAQVTAYFRFFHKETKPVLQR